MKDFYKIRDDDLRSQFDSIAEEYDKYRLSYPDKLFTDIFNYTGEIRSALEIGIGTGKATVPFLNKGISVVAIEPNPNMSAIALRNNRSKGSLNVLNGKFEDYYFDHTFDLVYAASSFQWLRSDERIDMIVSCLKNGGVFAKFKTITIVDPDRSEGSRLLYDIYQDVLPEYLPKEHKRIKKTYKEFEKTFFTDVVYYEYYQDHFYDAEQYIAFMNTYTEYIRLEKVKRNEFENRILNTIGAKKIIITQKCTLDMAKIRL